MIRALIVSLGLVFAWLVTPTPALASGGCHWVRIEYMVDGAIQVKFEQRCDGTHDSGSQTVATSLPPRDSDWDASCVRLAISLGKDPFEFCDLPPDAELPSLTPGMVAAAFRRIPLPPSVLVVQPAGGRTLVNFATNFYTESGPFTRTVVLLGQRVELRIWPSRFGWVFGDGASLVTASAGSPFPDLEVTHGYRSAGRVGPRVDTTYAAEFRVDGGRWRAVPGSVTIAGAPVGLEVITARPVLVAAR